jgi:hypothetical protein
MIITFLEISYSPGGVQILHPSSPSRRVENLRNMAAHPAGLPYTSGKLHSDFQFGCISRFVNGFFE